MNTLRSVFAVLLILFTSGSLLAQSGREIIEESHLRSRLDGLESRSTLEIHDGRGNVRVRETTMASRMFSDGTEKRVIVFISPADVKGTSMLIYDYKARDDAMWIFLPALRKSRKIVSTEKAKSFMGSEFTNGDLSIESMDDFLYEISGQESLDGTDCWKIIVKPVSKVISKELGYKEKILWVAKSDYMPRKSIIYNDKDVAIKELLYSGIKELDSKNQKYFIGEMKVKNLINNRYSLMRIEDLQYNPSVSEDYFTLSFLKTQL